jgi:hypothetical protein
MLMTADLTTVVIAVLGLAGTLSSPLLGQRIAARARQQEFELHRQERLEERADARQRSDLAECRSAYAALNTAARQYAQELRAYLRVIAAGDVDEQDRAGLAEARRTYRDLYSEAQMILPDTVFGAAVSVNEGLGRAYGLARQLETARAQPGSPDGDMARELNEAQEYCRVTLYDLLADLRQLMREDLGVAGHVSAVMNGPASAEPGVQQHSGAGVPPSL